MVSCVGKAPSKCLQVQKSATPDPSAWETYHARIRGFEYEAGYFYKIRVKEVRPDTSDLPADIASMEYTMIEILERKQDKKFLINAAWSLTQINEISIPDHIEGTPIPRLEIQVGEMRYLGNDGCNNYSGGIIELEEHSIRFGVVALTRMMCPDMSIPDLFNTSLPGIRTWQIEENKLHLFNAEGIEVMLLRRSD